MPTTARRASKRSAKADAASERLARLRAALRGAKLGGFYATREEDVRYLSGFTGSDSTLLITSSKAFLITDARYTEEAEGSAPAFEVVTRRGGMEKAVGELIRKLGPSRIGFAADAMTVAEHRRLASEAKGTALVAAGRHVADLRRSKDDGEIRAIRKALRCAEAAFEEVRAGLRLGMTEMEVRLALEWAMRQRGASDAAFETIVAEGPNASRPHAHAGGRKLRAGSMLLIDFGARVGGYHSDLTRVLFFDRIPPLWRKRYELTRAAQTAGIDACRPGATCKDVDEAARAVFRAAGQAEAFAHSLGHGVGLAVHEGPRLASASEDMLRPGDVVTVEPGIYYPGRGGIRIEDMVWITETGGRVLSRLPKSLDEMIVST